MKTILAPTDFSDVAANSIEYAAETARLFKAKLVLFHAYHPPVVATEAPMILPTLDELEKDCIKYLNEIKLRLQTNHKNELEIDCVCRCGFAVEEIQNYARENKMDLIIMGMQGAAGYLSEKLIGSVTTALFTKSYCPVIAIDKNVKFKDIKKIALACDFKEIANRAVLKPLKDLAQFFKAHVYVLNVVREPQSLPTVEEAIAGVKLEHALEEVNHSFCHTQNENVIDGINGFVAEENIDMVVMIPRKHSVLSKMFSEPKTKQMAFNTTVPLMTLPE